MFRATVFPVAFIIIGANLIDLNNFKDFN